MCEKFTHYSIDPVKLVKDTDNNESYKDGSFDNADEFILMGHYVGAHGIDISEGIYASGDLSSCTNMYKRITGEEFTYAGN